MFLDVLCYCDNLSDYNYPHSVRKLELYKLVTHRIVSDTLLDCEFKNIEKL